MPLSVAKPLLENALNAEFTKSRSNFKDQSKIAFVQAMTKFKTESADLAKPDKDGKIVGDIFTPAINAASEVFMTQMDKAYGDIFQNLGKLIATEVDKYVMQALITVPPGQVVVTAGSPAAQTGSTTTPTTAKIS
jgi:hypothetical protein